MPSIPAVRHLHLAAFICLDRDDSGQSLDVIGSVFFSPATVSASCCHGCCMKSFSTGCCVGWRRGPWCLLPSWLPCRLVCGFDRLLCWVKERPLVPLAIMAAMQTSLWLQEAVVLGEGEDLSTSCHHGCCADFSVATRGCCVGWRRGPWCLLPPGLPCRLLCGHKRLLWVLSLFKPFKGLFFIYYKLGFSLLLVWVKSVRQLSGFSDLKKKIKNKIKSDWISKGGNEELCVSKAF